MKSYEELKRDLQELDDEYETVFAKEQKAYNKRLMELNVIYDKKTEEGMTQFRQLKEELELEHKRIAHENRMIHVGKVRELIAEYYAEYYAEHYPREPKPGEVPEGMWFDPYMEQLRAVWREKTADREGLWLRLKAAHDEYVEHSRDPEVLERYRNERYIENPRDREELRARTAEQLAEVQSAFRQKVKDLYSGCDDRYDPELAERLDNGTVPDEELDDLIIQNTGNVTMLHIIFDYCHRARIKETDTMNRYEKALNDGGKTEYNVLCPIIDFIMKQVETDEYREIYWCSSALSKGLEYQIRRASWTLYNIAVKPERERI